MICSTWSVGVSTYLQRQAGTFSLPPYGKQREVTHEESQKILKTADKLRKNNAVAEYKHIVLGLIFLKYHSDACEERCT